MLGQEEGDSSCCPSLRYLHYLPTTNLKRLQLLTLAFKAFRSSLHKPAFPFPLLLHPSAPAIQGYFLCPGPT